MRKLELSRVICFEIAKGLREITGGGWKIFGASIFFKSPLVCRNFFLGHMTYWF